ncbi:hypothetical protein J4453_02120 [Candidatus Woesearchaeota archaeon]|nr:hypothetical protein [Candidatus Woesearchaeota archaeon]
MKAELISALQNLQSAIDHIIKNNVDVTQKKEASLYDYKEKKHQYYLSVYRKSMEDLQKKWSQLGQLKSDSNKKVAAALQSAFDVLNGHYLNKNPEAMVPLVDFMLETVGQLETEKGAVRFSITAKDLPAEIREDITADAVELEKCFAAGCYRSAIILCGRLLETALHRKYFEVTGNDMLEKTPGIGLGKIIAKLEENNVSLDPGLTQQIHLVNQVRIFSVHKKQQSFYPSKAQTEAMILYTLDVVEKIMRKK